MPATPKLLVSFSGADETQVEIHTSKCNQAQCCEAMGLVRERTPLRHISVVLRFLPDLCLLCSCTQSGNLFLRRFLSLAGGRLVQSDVRGFRVRVGPGGRKHGRIFDGSWHCRNVDGELVRMRRRAWGGSGGDVDDVEMVVSSAAELSSMEHRLHWLGAATKCCPCHWSLRHVNHLASCPSTMPM